MANISSYSVLTTPACSAFYKSINPHTNESILGRYEKDIDSQFKGNSPILVVRGKPRSILLKAEDDTLITSSFSYYNHTPTELKIAKFALDNMVATIDRLQELTNFYYEVILENGTLFKIKLEEKNIPHLFALASYGTAKAMAGDGSIFYDTVINECKNDSYLNSIKKVITQYKEEILYYLSLNSGDKKEIFCKMGYKTIAMMMLLDQLEVQDINNLSIYKDTVSQTDVNILLLPLKDRNSYYYILIEKNKPNDDTYYVKSSRIITHKEKKYMFDNNSKYQKLSLGMKSFVFKHSSDKKIPLLPIMSLDVKPYKDIDLISKLTTNNERAVLAQQNEFTSIGDNILVEKIRSELNLMFCNLKISSDLPSLLAKSTVTLHNLERHHYYSILIANSNYFRKAVINYVSNIINYDSIIDKSFKGIKDKSKTTNTELDIDISGKNNIAISSNGIISAFSFSSIYNSIREYLDKKISLISDYNIKNKNDLEKYLFDYFTCYMINYLFNNHVYGVYNSPDISNKTITIISNSYPNLLSRLLEIGLLGKTDMTDYPIMCISSFEEIRNNYKAINNYSDDLDEAVDNVVQDDYDDLRMISSIERGHVLFLVELKILEKCVNAINSGNNYDAIVQNLLSKINELHKEDESISRENKELSQDTLYLIYKENPLVFDRLIDLDLIKELTIGFNHYLVLDTFESKKKNGEKLISDKSSFEYCVLENDLNRSLEYISDYGNDNTEVLKYVTLIILEKFINELEGNDNGDYQNNPLEISEKFKQLVLANEK